MSFPRSIDAAASRSRRALRPLARAASRLAPTGLLGLTLMPAAFADTGMAPVDTGPTPPAQQVAVTAMRMPVPVADTIADVTVLTREDLDRFAGASLPEVLATQAGIQISSNGGLGTATGVFIRGLEARHTLLLVDGVRVDSATLGLPSFDNLPVALIDHVEIVRGPLSSIYGADAAGGVIQVFTRRGHDGLGGQADLTAGSLGYVAADGGVRWGGGGFDLAADASHVKTDGFSATNPHVPFGQYNPDRDGFDQDAGSVRLGWQPNADWRVEGLALTSSGLVHYDNGLPDPGQTDDSRARLRNEVQAVTLMGRVLPAWRTKLQAARSQDDYDTVASASAYDTLGTIRTIEKRFSWENTVDTPVGTALGVVEQTSQDVSKPDAPYDVSHRDLGGLALALHGSAGAHTWQASLRRDHDSQFGNQTTGGLGYAYAITPSWEAGASYGTSFVAPSFNQLYYPQYGNPDLQPERGHSTELLTRWHDDVQEVRFSAYRQRVRGYITPGEDPVNVGEVAVDGVTVAWEGHWRDGTFGLSADHLSPRDVTNHTWLVRRAKNDAKATADWHVADAWTVGATWVAYSSRPDTNYDANFNPVPVTLGGYGTVDLRADWHFARDWTLGARVNNVGDKRYETAYGYNQPPREGFVVLTWRTR
jgi:vitamin B12 transporter